jgi:hypothetical protein
MLNLHFPLMYTTLPAIILTSYQELSKAEIVMAYDFNTYPHIRRSLPTHLK